MDVATFYAGYSAVLSDNRIEDWPAFFTEDCRYEVVSRANRERGLPLATMRYFSRGALADRVAALQSSLVYAPRWIAHLVGSVLVLEQSGSRCSARSTIAVYQTLADGEGHLLLVGRTFDEIHIGSGDVMAFAERTVVYDSERIPGALVYPV
jgi:3-phenylpropionate/cinnamic acid dioxygenase small subunit